MLYFYNYFSLKTITSSFTTFKIFNFPYFLTLICVIFSFFSSDFLQNIVSAVGILTFGILHGANDLKILSKKDLSSKNFIFLPLWIIYICIVSLGIFIFYFIPGIALLLFVIISCYHFGEQHWEARVRFKKLKPLFFTSYGILIFSLLFVFNIENVNKVILQITSIKIPQDIFILSFGLSFSTFLVFFIFNKCLWQNLLSELLLLIFLGLVFFNSSLLFGFGFYFVVWHSLPSLSSQIKFLYDKEVSKPYVKYFKEAFFYWVLAIIGLVGFYILKLVPQEQYLSIFFSFLAAITFPHVIVMGFMFYSTKSKSL